jgi:uncharacterized membrane protein YfcA
MFLESLQGLRKSKAKGEAAPAPARESAYARAIGLLPFKTNFEKSGIVLSPLVPLFLGSVVGVLAAIMGVGGGFIMVPVMVYLLRMPMHVVVGTSLFQVLFTCINVTIMQAYSNRTVDFVLALLLLVGSTLGAQLGARLSTRLKEDQLKIFLASLVLLVMVKMLLSLVLNARHAAFLTRRSLGHATLSVMPVFWVDDFITGIRSGNFGGISGPADRTQSS